MFCSVALLRVFVGVEVVVVLCLLLVVSVVVSLVLFVVYCRVVIPLQCKCKWLRLSRWYRCLLWMWLGCWWCCLWWCGMQCTCPRVRVLSCCYAAAV